MTTVEAARFEPPPSDQAQAFWDGTREQLLVLPWCTGCNAPFFYPRANCPTCLGDDIEWKAASGLATVYAVTVEFRPQNPMMASRAPYAVALVELQEGPRMLTNIINADPVAVAVGDRVEVTWEALSDGRNLPVFQPAGA